MIKSQKLVVLDAGGQYCHLIARRLRHVGVHAEVRPCSTRSAELKEYSGIVISGGPASVYDPASPTVDRHIFSLRVPVLGICYGHQLMAATLGGRVAKGTVAEYGPARLTKTTSDTLFKNLRRSEPVWMSHRDTVLSVPLGFEVMGETDSCPIAAMGNHKSRFYGVQFHPEVVHTERGEQILRSFAFDICKCEKRRWNPKQQINKLVAEIQAKAAGRKVFFLVSGGVDSSVAFTLCAKALGGERVVGLYVDTGLMRKQDRADVERLISSCHATIHILDAQNEFIELLRDTYNPEEKRRKIGQKFVEIHERVLGELLGGSRDEWMLGQGTIYPDTIESGGTKLSSKIKTHHNRVESIQDLIREGKVIEPLSEFYKDEVREIGHALGMDKSIVDKHPFPGPGLAVRCLAAKAEGKLKEHPAVSALASSCGLRGAQLALKTVGVKGDERCYQEVAILAGDPQNVDFAGLSNQITNDCPDISRVVYVLTRDDLKFSDWRVLATDVRADRLELLRSADDLVHRIVTDYDSRLLDQIWQFPIVLIPLMHSETGSESIVLRPVESTDGMTATFSKLPIALLSRIAKELQRALKVEVLYDITNKPPATIEWE